MTAWKSVRPVAIAVALALLIASAAFFLASAGARSTSAITEPSGTAMTVELPPPLGPTGSQHGIPVGWRHDRDGAEAAAAAFVRSTGPIVKAGPLERRDMIVAIATDDYGPTLLRDVEHTVDRLALPLENHGLVTSDLLWSELALTTSSEVYSADVVDVSVWSVVLIGVDGGDVARQLWRTSTIQLRWVDGDWKVADWTTSEGPTPASVALASASPVDDVRSSSSWHPAPSGDRP
jgi:hypothetical protein